MHEDLKVPATLRPLDRTAGMSSLLQEVALGVDAKEIWCLFVRTAPSNELALDLVVRKTSKRWWRRLVLFVNDVKENTDYAGRRACDEAEEVGETMGEESFCCVCGCPESCQNGKAR